MDWGALASALLAEVGLTFDDVYDLGRPWNMGPTGFSITVSRPAYSGICHGPAWDNPTARQRHLIGLTGPVDSEWMLYILAHECGHVYFSHHGKSSKIYAQEYQAEVYAIDALSRHLGRAPHDFLITMAKKYIRRHCRERDYDMKGTLDHRSWEWGILLWCGYTPKFGMKEVEQSNLFTGANHAEVVMHMDLSRHAL